MIFHFLITGIHHECVESYAPPLPPKPRATSISYGEMRAPPARISGTMSRCTPCAGVDSYSAVTATKRLGPNRNRYLVDVGVGELVFEHGHDLLEIDGLEPVRLLRLRLLHQHCPVRGPHRDAAAAAPPARPRDGRRGGGAEELAVEGRRRGGGGGQTPGARHGRGGREELITLLSSGLLSIEVHRERAERRGSGDGDMPAGSSLFT